MTTTNPEKTFAEQIADKQNKKKKIIAFSSIAVILVLIISIVVLAVVNINLKPSMISDPSYIYFNNETTYKKNPNDEKYKEFMKEFDTCFTTSTLNGIFSGRLGGYDIIEDKTQISLSDELNEKNYVNFLYDDEQTLKFDNGTVYFSKYDTSKSIEFSQVVMVLSEEDRLQNTSLYFKYETSEGNVRYAEIILQANTSKMFDLFEDRNIV